MNKKQIFSLAGLAALALGIGFIGLQTSKNPLKTGKYRLQVTESEGTSFDECGPRYLYKIGGSERNYQLGTSYADTNSDGLVDMITMPKGLSQVRPQFVFDKKKPLDSYFYFPTPLFERHTVYRSDSAYRERFEKADATLQRLLKASKHVRPDLCISGTSVWGP